MHYNYKIKYNRCKAIYPLSQIQILICNKTKKLLNIKKIPSNIYLFIF